MPILRNVEGFGSNGGVRARLTDLALMKAEAWMGRDENRDLVDFPGGFPVPIGKNGREGREFQGFGSCA